MIQCGSTDVAFRNKRGDFKIDLWPPNLASQSCFTFHNTDVFLVNISQYRRVPRDVFHNTDVFLVN